MFLDASLTPSSHFSRQFGLRNAVEDPSQCVIPLWIIANCLLTWALGIEIINECGTATSQVTYEVIEEVCVYTIISKKTLQASQYKVQLCIAMVRIHRLVIQR
eukprot:scaffold1300_cov120-Skeletonema_dohrnii-CCMP3373.AAC.3